MKLVDLTWHPYLIPFRHPFVTAHGALSHRSGTLVHLSFENGSEGYGEIAPLPEFAGTSLEDILRVLFTLAEELRGREAGAIQQFLADLSLDSRVPAPLICGLETALLDALAFTNQVSLAAFLAKGPACQAVLVNTVIGGQSPEAMVERARIALAKGFSCFKLKITSASPEIVECVAAVRAALGPEPRLRLDANEGWNFEQARTLLSQCAAYDIEYVEQPLRADDLEGMARLRRITPVPLAADESLSDLEATQCVLRENAADVLILKPQMLGGLQRCRQIIQEAQKHQIRCVITSTLDAGIGVTAALQLAAASPEITLACGLATLDLLENDLLQHPLTLRSGQMELPEGPGLGVRVDTAMLRHYALRK